MEEPIPSWGFLQVMKAQPEENGLPTVSFNMKRMRYGKVPDR